MTRNERAVPAWVPEDVRNYVFHTEFGQPIRALARSKACHASTIMHQVRKVEARRDDPLVDRAIKALGLPESAECTPTRLEWLQALRKLAAPDTLLAIAVDMEQGVVLHDIGRGGAEHNGTTLPATTAMSLALQGWIALRRNSGRVLRYRITPAGRSALRELTAQSENHARAMAEGPANFEGPAKGIGTWEGKPAPSRMITHDSPVQALSRRKDRDGKPFLTRAMVRAAERLREDFELARIGQTVPDNWVHILMAAQTAAPQADSSKQGRNTVNEDTPARAHLTSAFEFLGPGLAEVALRCCCLLEGLETTEKHMGWAARSGKVVLRIALQRLVLHYGKAGEPAPKIG